MISRLALTFAVLGATSVLLMTLLGGAAFPGYNHASQFISELGARGAPHETLVRFAGFLPAGVFLCLFACGAYRTLPRARLTTFGLVGIAIYAIGYVAAAVFPCDPGCRPAHPSFSQFMHNVLGLIGYVLAPAFLLALGVSARRWPGGMHLAPLAFLAAVIASAGMLALSLTFAYAGVSQRVIEASVLLWVVMCGRYVSGRSATTA